MDVEVAISHDSAAYAYKGHTLGSETCLSVIQWALDSFLLSHLNPAHFDLYQSMELRAPLRLEKDETALSFQIQTQEKGVMPPYKLYLAYLPEDDSSC